MDKTDIPKLLDFFGSYISLVRIIKSKLVTVHTIKEAVNFGYNLVEIHEIDSKTLKVYTHTSPSHLWGYGGEKCEKVEYSGLITAVINAFQTLEWDFPTRKCNLTRWNVIRRKLAGGTNG